MIGPNNRTEALLTALAKAEPVLVLVLVFRSLVKGGVEGEIGILTAATVFPVLIGIADVRGEASNSVFLKKKIIQLYYDKIYLKNTYHPQIDWFQ